MNSEILEEYYQQAVSKVGKITFYTCLEII